MSENIENKASQDQKKVVIELDNVRRDFLVGDETVHALKGVSFKIYEGEFVTIMGKSGSVYPAQPVGLSRHAIEWRILPRWRVGTHHVAFGACRAAQPQDRFYLSEL